jgi:choline dehydrogenase-like flavoprotein
VTAEDSSTCVIAGQTWGGGGTVNWSASLQPQDFVRKEWSEGGLPLFTSAEFQDCLDTVCGEMGVATEQIQHNPPNAKLLEGARKLGMTGKIVPQNTAGQTHYCGYCTMGCHSCGKKGPANSWLVKASNRGAKFMEGYEVHKVIFETKKSGRKVAVGVEGTWTSRDQYGGVAGTKTSRKVIIKAKRVVISAGTMHTPVILQRSGLKNKHIGKNLKLHPVSIIGAIHDEETRPWDGGILTAVVSSLENLDGKGHGTKLECTTMLPSTWLAFPVWRGGVDWKVLAPRHRNMAGYISLSRDIGSGSVYPDPKDGRPRFSYNTIKKDRKHIIEGLVALAKINYVVGAREIFGAIPGLETFVRQDPKLGVDVDGINDARFQEWLKKLVKIGLPDPDTTCMSAHQMGTCRMGATPAKGAIDKYGRIWEADNLYVADASAFPSASGVNPMITNMGISEWISRNLIMDLKTGGRTKGKL